MTVPLDPERCPLCGGPNSCGMAQGNTKCWCYFVTVSKEALAQVPDEARDKACLCRPCATGRSSPTRIEDQVRELHRKR